MALNGRPFLSRFSSSTPSFFFFNRTPRLDRDAEFRCATAEEAAGWAGDDATATTIAFDERSRRGSALHRGGHTTPALLDYGGHCRRPAARPDARHGVPAVYENNISFCVAMIDIYSSVRPGIAL